MQSGPQERTEPELATLRAGFSKLQNHLRSCLPHCQQDDARRWKGVLALQERREVMILTGRGLHSAWQYFSYMVVFTV
jgi:hypothetical protein